MANYRSTRVAEDLKLSSDQFLFTGCKVSCHLRFNIYPSLSTCAVETQAKFDNRIVKNTVLSPHKETTGVCRQWQKLVNCLTCLWLDLFCYFLRLNEDISSSLFYHILYFILY